MKTKLALSLFLSFIFYLTSSQIPQGFTYQAIARDGTNPVTSPIDVKFTIQSTDVGGTTFWIELHSDVQPNASGLFSLIVGNGVKQAGSTVNVFGDIDWTVSPKYLKTQIDIGSGFVTMGTSQLVSVPYSLVAESLAGPVGKLGVNGTTSNLNEALFEVKNNSGQTVFAVYNEGVRIYVDNGAKGVKGGFAIGGFGTEKAGTSQPLFVVNADSIRAYINPTLLEKGIKGGFAIGGFNGNAVRDQYLLVNSHSAQINMRESMKGVKAGFAIGTYSPGKADPIPTTYTNLTKENYFIGHEAGKSITTGLYNSVIGFQSGYSLNEGQSNSFFGFQSGFNNKTGNSNLFLGYKSGYTNEIGNYNSFLGYNSGSSNSSGAQNSFIGSFSGVNNTIGNYNTFVGYNSGFKNQSGNSNDFFGTNSGYSNISGSNNICLGTEAGYSNTGGSFNIYSGYQSGYASTASYNIFLGYQAGLLNTTGTHNIFIGYKAGGSNKTSIFNTFIGYLTGSWWDRTQRSDYSNTFLGFGAGVGLKQYITSAPLSSGDCNTFVGGSAAGRILWGESNIIIGEKAAIEARYAARNVFMGAFINYAYDGYSRTDTIYDNVWIGYAVAGSNYAGRRNVFIGSQSNAGYKSGGFNGSGNVFIGYQSGFNENGSNKLYIDNSRTSTPLIYGDFTDGSEKLVFNGSVGIGTTPGAKLSIAGLTGSATGSNLIINGNNVYYLTSLRESKDEILPLTDNFNKILDATPVSFRDKYSGMKGIGYIAEDFENAGLQNLLVYEDKKLVSLRYDLISIYNLELLKQQKIKIETVEKENSQLKNELQQLRSEIEQIKVMLSKDGSAK